MKKDNFLSIRLSNEHLVPHTGEIKKSFLDFSMNLDKITNLIKMIIELIRLFILPY